MVKLTKQVECSKEVSIQLVYEFLYTDRAELNASDKVSIEGDVVTVTYADFIIRVEVNGQVLFVSIEVLNDLFLSHTILHLYVVKLKERFN